jgi:hypothetical protein
MIIRRIALTIGLASVFASANLVGPVRAQQQPPPPPQQQQAAPGGTNAQGTTPSRNPPITDQRVKVPSSNPTFTESERYLILLDCYKPTAPSIPTKPSILDPHCEATVALLNFIDRLGPFAGPFGTSNPIPNCDPGMIGAINDINLKVNTAIEFHKYSDKIFDDRRYDQRKISPRDKSKGTTDNDIKIKLITDILAPYIVRYGSQRSDSAPLIYYRDLVRYAGDVLNINNDLSVWGVDVGFLTAARGYAIYQFVFNCVRTHDARVTAALMAARAHAVRTAAESESWFSQEIENIQGERSPRPALRRWLVENGLLDGGTRMGGGFPRQIYLGSSHGFEYWTFEPTPGQSCPRGQVRNFYGKLKAIYEKIGNLNVITKFESDGDVIEECEYEINQNGWPAINALLTNATRAYVPKGGGQKADYEQMLKGIAGAITGHIARVTDEMELERCELGLNKDEEKCKKLAAELGRQREVIITQDISEEKKQIVAELIALQRMAFVIRNILSPRPRHEDLRGHR